MCKRRAGFVCGLIAAGIALAISNLNAKFGSISASLK